MTYQIRHHTEQLHRKAAKCAPAFTLRNEPYPEHYEAAYAKAMRNMAVKEGRRLTDASNRPPAKNHRTLDRHIIKALENELTIHEIAETVSRSLGYKVHHNLITKRLLSGLSRRVSKAQRQESVNGQTRDIFYWSLNGTPKPLTDMRKSILDMLEDGSRLTLAQMMEKTGMVTRSQVASLGNTLRFMCRDNILTRAKSGGCYEYQLAHVSCKDRIAAAKAEAR